jgi:hypothetical protein
MRKIELGVPSKSYRLRAAVESRLENYKRAIRPKEPEPAPEPAPEVEPAAEPAEPDAKDAA